jgi:hypothetical protein
MERKRGVQGGEWPIREPRRDRRHGRFWKIFGKTGDGFWHPIKVFLANKYGVLDFTWELFICI